MISIKLPAFLLSLLLSFGAFIFPAKAQKEASPSTVFSNTTPIAINSAPATTFPVAANLYPSNISVSGMPGNITRVEVILRGLSNAKGLDNDFLLVGPTGAKLIFLSDVNTQFSDGIYSFSDDAASVLGAGIFTPGNYKPTNNSDGANTDNFPAPAPAGPHNNTTFSATFNGSDPNGTWSLYSIDDTKGGAASLNSGWALKITTSGSPQTFSNSNFIGFSDVITRSNPYGTPINVSGMTGGISDLKVTISDLSHTATSQLEILLVSPNGRAMFLMSDAGGGGVSGVTYTFDDAAPSALSENISNPSGVYKSTNFTGFTFANTDDLLSPAPPIPYTANFPLLSGFDGFSPNGEWRLYVVDTDEGFSGTISGGWSLDITTAPVVPPIVSCATPNLLSASYAAGSNPTNLAVADFNNDTRLDVAVTNQISNDISILLNDGSGGLQTQSLATAGQGPYAIAAGLLNTDSNQDLAVVNSSSNNVSILLGNGSGGFSAAVNFPVGLNPISVSIADFNNDNKRDLAVANFGGFFIGSVSVLLGNGNGGFGPPLNLRTRTQPSFVKAINFNGDSFMDIAVANFGSGSLSTFAGLGDGSFLLGQNLTALGDPTSFDYFDSDGDNIPDLLATNYNSDAIVRFLGTSTGTFGSGTTIGPAGPNPISIVGADILGSGRMSAAVATSGNNLIKITNNFATFDFFFAGFNPNAISKGDFNQDGKIDLVTANAGSNSVTILKNSCLAAKGNLFDFSGDKKTDYAVFRPAVSTWFKNLEPTGTLLGRADDIPVPADYNGDLITDYAFYRPESGLWVALGNVFLPFGLPTDIPTPADFDGDGKADIAVFRPSSGTFFVRQSSNNSVLAMQFGANGDRPVPSDYDGDGKADFAVFRPSDGVWYILQSMNGFTAKQFGTSSDKTVQADYDSDGKTDVAVYRNGTWYILKSSDGNFYGVGFGVASDIPVPGDYDADGKFDQAIYRPSLGSWYVLRSSDGSLQTAQYGNATDIPAPSAFVR